MTLLVSGTHLKKKHKFPKSKMTDFVKILEIRLISGQAFCKFASFQAGNVGKGTKTTQLFLEKILNHFLTTFEVPGGFFLKI
jgi:hypothetical protein